MNALAIRGQYQRIRNEITDLEYQLTAAKASLQTLQTNCPHANQSNDYCIDCYLYLEESPSIYYNNPRIK